VGLIKTGLKAVVAVKTADVIHERILQRQAAQWGQQGHSATPGGPAQDAGPTSTSPSAADVLDQLTRLGELRANGVLTDDEFDTQKARILNS
jgi:hypothetical protein